MLFQLLYDFDVVGSQFIQQTVQIDDPEVEHKALRPAAEIISVGRKRRKGRWAGLLLPFDAVDAEMLLVPPSQRFRVFSLKHHAADACDFHALELPLELATANATIFLIPLQYQNQ